MNEVSFFVAGEPAPKGSKSRNRYGAMYESSKRLRPWMDAVATEAMIAKAQKRIRFTGATQADLAFLTGRNDDLDKLIRGVLDGLQEGQLLEDDKLIVHVDAWRHRVAKEYRGCWVHLYPA